MKAKIVFVLQYEIKINEMPYILQFIPLENMLNNILLTFHQRRIKGEIRLRKQE